MFVVDKNMGADICITESVGCCLLSEFVLDSLLAISTSGEGVLRGRVERALIREAMIGDGK